MTTDFPGRRRVKGGRSIHATRMVPRGGVGVQIAACGKHANAELPERPDEPVTCGACLAAMAATPIT